MDAIYAVEVARIPRICGPKVDKLLIDIIFDFKLNAELTRCSAGRTLSRF